LTEQPITPTDPDIQEPTDALPPITLADLPPRLREAAARAGWDQLMPVQSKAIPYLLAGRDLMIQSRTGSGKTAAYVLPILERIDPRVPACQALVLVPTRELASQVARDAELLAGNSGVRVVAVYGGVGYGPQLAGFRDGAHLVVGTPGRILDHLLRRNLTLDKLRVMVFDEADRMLSMGFYEDMLEVRSFLPDHPISAYLFSATFPPHVMRLASQFLRDPQMLSLSRDHVHVMEVEHQYYVISGTEKKERCLVRIIELENPASALIFCNTKDHVSFVTTVLRRFGYDADEISSDLTQAAREEVMARIRRGELRFLVATDVASRGIDLPDLSHVIIYEPPEDVEDYIHRAGRTGRVGASGVAISLVNAVERMALARIGKRYAIDLQEQSLPTDEDVARVVGERAEIQLEARLRARDKLKVERMQRFLPLAREMSQDEEGLALLAMLLDDAYQPPRLTSTGEPPERRRLPERPRSGGGGEGGGGSRSGRRRRRSGSRRPEGQGSS